MELKILYADGTAENVYTVSAEFSAYFLSIVCDLVGDRQYAHLLWAEPCRQIAGVLLDQPCKCALIAAHRCAVDDVRTFFLSILIDVVHVVTL